MTNAPFSPAPGTGALRVVLGDQCTPTLSALEGLDAASDTVLMMEVLGECTYVPHHPKKIVLILSAMRHFAGALRARGVRVEYIRLDDPANTGSFRGEVLRACARLRPARIVATEPGEWRVLEDMRTWHEPLGQGGTGIDCDIRDDTRFLSRIQDFRAWARGRGAFRMETFYRAMRKRTGLLMNGDDPEGGQWNYDPENRKPLPHRVSPPPVPRFPPDAVTQEVMALAARYSPHISAAWTGSRCRSRHRTRCGRCTTSWRTAWRSSVTGRMRCGLGRACCSMP